MFPLLFRQTTLFLGFPLNTPQLIYVASSVQFLADYNPVHSMNSLHFDHRDRETTKPTFFIGLIHGYKFMITSLSSFLARTYNISTPRHTIKTNAFQVF